MSESNWTWYILKSYRGSKVPAFCFATAHHWLQVSSAQIHIGWGGAFVRKCNWTRVFCVYYAVAVAASAVASSTPSRCGSSRSSQPDHEERQNQLSSDSALPLSPSKECPVSQAVEELLYRSSSIASSTGFMNASCWTCHHDYKGTRRSAAGSWASTHWQAVYTWLRFPCWCGCLVLFTPVCSNSWGVRPPTQLVLGRLNNFLKVPCNRALLHGLPSQRLSTLLWELCLQCWEGIVSII